MKKHFVFVFLIPLIAVADISDKSLIGHWHWTDGRNSSDMTFRADHTFTAVVHIGSMSSIPKGTWSIKGDILRYEYTSDAAGVIAPGTRDQDKLLQVTKDHLTIRTLHTGDRTYERVQ